MVSGIFSIPLEAHHLRADGTHRPGSSRSMAMREYIGSEENQLVQFAAESLLGREPQYYPVVLFGPSGTGKSLLALGLAEQWRGKYPEDSVIVTCGADFARSYANAVDTDCLKTFRRKSRSADLFVLDDVHLMVQKHAAQEELVRAIDALLERGRAVLITDKTTPSVDQSLVPALRSRLLGGLAVPLAAPGAPARGFLLRRLAHLHGVHFTDEAIELLASSPRQEGPRPLTVPQLNHAVVQLGFAEEPDGQVVDVERVRQFLSEMAIREQPTLRAISTLVARHFSLSSRDLRGPSRRRNIVRARGVAMLLAWRLTDNSLDAVGDYFGKRDHTTVLHACRRIELLQETDPAIAKALEELAAQLNFG